MKHSSEKNKTFSILRTFFSFFTVLATSESKAVDSCSKDAKKKKITNWNDVIENSGICSFCCLLFINIVHSSNYDHMSLFAKEPFQLNPLR